MELSVLVTIRHEKLHEGSNYWTTCVGHHSIEQVFVIVFNPCMVENAARYSKSSLVVSCVCVNITCHKCVGRT